MDSINDLGGASSDFKVPLALPVTSTMCSSKNSLGLQRVQPPPFWADFCRPNANMFQSTWRLETPPHPPSRTPTAVGGAPHPWPTSRPPTAFSPSDPQNVTKMEIAGSEGGNRLPLASAHPHVGIHLAMDSINDLGGASSDFKVPLALPVTSTMGAAVLQRLAPGVELRLCIECTCVVSGKVAPLLYYIMGCCTSKYGGMYARYIALLTEIERHSWSFFMSAFLPSPTLGPLGELGIPLTYEDQDFTTNFVSA